MSIRLAASAFAALLAVRVAAQDGPPVNIEQLLRELQQLRAQRTEQFAAGLQRAIREFSAASGSPSSAVSFYEEATRAVQFEGARGDSSQFRDWKDTQKDLLSDKAFGEAVRLHLRWAVLTLRRAAGENVEDLIPEVERHIGDLEDYLEKAGNMGRAARDILNSPVPQSVFGTWYQLADHLAGVKGWPMAGGNPDNLEDSLLFSHYRQAKDARLLALWDDRIDRAKARATRSGLAVDAEKFKSQTLPSLEWSRAGDLAHLGRKNAALAEMIRIVRAHPGHPAWEGWLGQLETSLKEAAAPKPPAPAPAAAGAAAPAPAPAQP